jgi:hypothetical protein
VGKGEGEGGRSTNNLALGVVLGSMARALELVLSSDPRDDAAKMGADGIDSEVLNGTIGTDDEVGGVTPEALGKRVVSSLVGGEPRGGLDVSSEGILSSNSTASSPSRLGNEEEGIGNSLGKECSVSAHGLNLLQCRDLTREPAGRATPPRRRRFMRFLLFMSGT